jgi:glycosyltransferase involved in cell wall biosynthesis
VLANPAWKNRRENPYGALLYSAIKALKPKTAVIEYEPKRSLQKFDIAHWHWPEWAWSRRRLDRSLLRSGVFFLECLFLKARGARIVWTAHNAEPHQLLHPLLARVCGKLFVSMSDGVIFLSVASKKQLFLTYPDLIRKKSAVIAHGDYRPVLRAPYGKQQARSLMRIPDNGPVIGFIGRIKPYKCLGQLVSAFGQIRRNDVRLLIAGEPDGSEETSGVLEAASENKQIVFKLGLLGDAALQRSVEACDLLVFPNTKIVNSGAVLYALSNERPVLVANTPAMQELARLAGGDRIYLFDGILSGSVLAKTVALASVAAAYAQSGIPSWEEIACQHLKFFNEVCCKE